MILSPSPVSSHRFSFDPSTNTLVAELSDLGRSFRFERVYDDACDVGLTVVSARTGLGVVFAIEHEERDREGDLLWIDLLPVNRRGPGNNCRVRLYND